MVVFKRENYLKDLNWNRGVIPLRTRRRNLRKVLHYVTGTKLWEGAESGKPQCSTY